MVHPGGNGHRYLRGERESHASSRTCFPVGLVCRNSLAAGITYPRRRLCLGPGAALLAARTSAFPDALCRGRANGVDQLLAAIRLVYSLLLPLHDRSLWTYRSRNRAALHNHSLCRTGCFQQLVVAAISLRPHGVALARYDLRQIPIHA